MRSSPCNKKNQTYKKLVVHAITSHATTMLVYTDILYVQLQIGLLPCISVANTFFWKKKINVGKSCLIF